MDGSNSTVRDREVACYLESCRRCFALPELSLGILRPGVPMELFDTSQPAGSKVYQVGSLTKLVTALAVLKLREQRLLDLDDEVSRHLAWFGRPAGGRPMTLRDLMLHTGGLPRGEFLARNPTAEDVQLLLGSLEPPVSPAAGEHPVKYSNLGYTLLGLVVEAAGGEPYAAFVRRHLLDPLHMHDSGFGAGADHPGMTAPHRLACFAQDRSSPYEVQAMPLLAAPHAAFGMFCTTRDYAKLLACLFNQGAGESGAVLQPGSIALLLALKQSMGQGLAACPGFTVRSASPHDVYFENAEHFGHSAALLMTPGGGFAVFAMTNRSSASPELAHMISTVFQHFTGERAPAPLDHDYHGKAAVAGVYAAEDGTVLSLTTCGTSLRAAVNGEPSSPFMYKGQNGFIKCEGTHRRYLFRMDCDLEVVAGLSAGPFYFRRQPCPPALPRLPKFAALTGIYRNPTVGRVALFERNDRLVLAYSPQREAVLEAVSTDVFLQTTGPFRNETVVFDARKHTLQLGALLFMQTSEHY